MNRGSLRDEAQNLQEYIRFNEAPIHESGKRMAEIAAGDRDSARLQ